MKLNLLTLPNKYENIQHTLTCSKSIRIHFYFDLKAANKVKCLWNWNSYLLKKLLTYCYFIYFGSVLEFP